jgi:hypothetical protein
MFSAHASGSHISMMVSNPLRPSPRGGVQTGFHLDQPITFGHMEIGTQVIPDRVDRAAARQAHRVLERQVLPAVGTEEITHGALPISNGATSAAASIRLRASVAHRSSSIVLTSPSNAGHPTSDLYQFPIVGGSSERTVRFVTPS